MLEIVVILMRADLNGMMEAEYIVKRRRATKRLNMEIRAMPEFAAVVAETEAYCYAHTRRLVHAQEFNHAREVVNGRK